MANSWALEVVGSCVPNFSVSTDVWALFIEIFMGGSTKGLVLMTCKE